MNISSNQIYLLISIILFIFLYFKVPTEKYNQTDDKNTIILEIDSLIVKVKLKNIYTHLRLIKENLIIFNDLELVYDVKVINKIKTLKGVVCRDLQSFSNLSDNWQNAKIDNSAFIRSDVEKESKIDLSDIILHIDGVIIHLHKNIKNRLILTNLYKLLKLFESNLPNDLYLSYNDIFHDDSYQNEIETPINGYARVAPKLNSFSHNITQGYGNEEIDGEIFSNDLENIKLKSYVKDRQIYIENSYTDYNTQLFGLSNKMTTTNKNGIKNYIPLCDINKLRNEYKKLKVNSGIDIESRSSLRNDYDL